MMFGGVVLREGIGMIWNAAIVIIILIIAVIAGSWVLSNVLLKPRVIKYDKLYQREIQEGRLTEKVYQGWSKKDFIIKSRYGYDLSCQMINDEISSRQFESPNTKLRIAIICHGYTCGKYSSMMYAELFLKRGITVLTYDHRNHGLSGKAHTSMGYYEKFDLQTVIDWCFETYGTNISIVAHGESMGAATVLSHLAIDGRIRCVIADCSYSDLRKQVKHLLKYRYHIPKFPFLYLARFIIRLRAGFWIDDVVPIDGAVRSNAPILFIHGLEDNFVPCSMSKEMYDAKPDRKELYLAPNARHAESCQKNREEYGQFVNDFLDKYYFN